MKHSTDRSTAWPPPSWTRVVAGLGGAVTIIGLGILGVTVFQVQASGLDDHAAKSGVVAGGGDADDEPRLISIANPVSATPTVSDAEELIAALKTATGGATIQLAPGRYAGISIFGINFTTPVTIQSADPIHRAVLVGLKIANSSGLALRDLDLTQVGSPDPYYPFRVANAHDLSLSNLDLHGDPSASPSSQQRGLYLSDDSDVSIEHCNFHSMWSALTANRNIRLKVIGNDFSNLDKGGVEIGGASVVIIADNTFEDFHVGRGTHSDVIQFYTTGTKESSRDITIRNNLYYRGVGDAVQGIFLGDEVGTLPFQDLTIEDNAIIGGMWNSIYVKHAAGSVKVDNNLAATWPGADVPGVGTSAAEKMPVVTTNFVAFIELGGDLSKASVSEVGNRGQVYMGPTGKVPTPPGNMVVGDVRDSGVALLRGWIAAHPTLDPVRAGRRSSRRSPS